MMNCCCRKNCLSDVCMVTVVILFENVFLMKLFPVKTALLLLLTGYWRHLCSVRDTTIVTAV